MKQKKIFVIFVSLIFIVFPFNVSAKSSTKDEVIYAVLTPEGNYDKLFVVNKFQLETDGDFTDYGSYDSVKNLTNVEPLELEDDKVQFTGKKGVFHYEGELHDEALPWDFSITYYLDGKEISPTQLAGKDGHVQMKLASKQDKAGASEFFENYIVQIGANFSMEETENLEAGDGMVANAGDDYQVQFTVMPEEEAVLTIEADVEDFVFEGFEINAVPSFIDIDEPDVGDMEGDMNSLQKAIKDINDGVLELRQGLADFNRGAAELYDGSSTYKAGMDELSEEVSTASKELDNAFKQFDEVMKQMDDISASEVEGVVHTLQTFPSVLKEFRNDLEGMVESYDTSFQTLSEAVEEIPKDSLSKEQIEALKKSDVDEEVIDVLLKSYEAGQTVKKAFKEAENYSSQVSVLLHELIEELDEMIEVANTLSDTLNDLSNVDELFDNIGMISDSYDEFRSGIDELTDGVISLANAYGNIHDGIGELSTGSKQLENGASQLYDGTSELKKGTDQLPDKLKEEIDALMEKYDKSDFDMISFVSEKNEQVEMVQFVMKTEAIEKVEEETKETSSDEKTMWQRFLDLFAWLKFWD